MKRTYWFLAALMIAAIMLAGCAPSTPAATGLLATIKQKGEIVVATSADYPPYESVDKAGNFTGFDVELMQEVGKRMGVKVKFQDLGFDALIASVQEKKVDAVIAAMQATPARLEKVDFSAEYHRTKDAFVVSSKSTLTINDPKDAAGKAIGVQTGTTHDTWVTENLVKPGLTKADQVFRYERADDAGRDLAAGRIEILMVNAEPAQDLAKNLGLKVALITDKTITAGQAIAIPKGETALKAELDRIIKEMQSDGTIKKLQDKYAVL